MARLAFGALALVDSVLLLHLFLSYDWLQFEIPHISESIASIVLVHPDAADRAARYRDLACQRGYKLACGT